MLLRVFCETVGIVRNPQSLSLLTYSDIFVENKKCYLKTNQKLHFHFALNYFFLKLNIFVVQKFNVFFLKMLCSNHLFILAPSLNFNLYKNNLFKAEKSSHKAQCFI